MEVKLFLNKDVNENANFYFEKGKKLKAKNPGLEKAITITKKEIEEFIKKKQDYENLKIKKEKITSLRKKEWYEKFRYTFTSSGFLCVIGKDAGTNEILIKKHMEENDLVLHTQAPGSPFCIIKEAKDKISKEEIYEAAQFTCCFSSQWKKGYGDADAFWVNPDQISKKAESGEYIAKGSFMIRGNKNIIKGIPLKICLGIETKKVNDEEGNEHEYEEIISGSENLCKKKCKNRYIKLEPGNENYKALSKEIKKRLKTSHLEDLPKYIPNNCKILKK